MEHVLLDTQKKIILSTLPNAIKAAKQLVQYTTENDLPDIYQKHVYSYQNYDTAFGKRSFSKFEIIKN